MKYIEDYLNLSFNITDFIKKNDLIEKDFENITFSKSIERPWGPGLMFELAVPMAIHLGCKNIVTIGWDIGDINKWKNIKPEVITDGGEF